jgi:very-short-patch-repair endonuclease
MVVMPLPAPVLRRAALSHGLSRRGDLLGAGLSASAVDRLLAAGLLQRLHVGVYRVAGTPSSWEQRQLAACWATGGVASHRAAARLWGIDLGSTPPVEVTVARERSPRSPGVAIHRSADLDARRTSHRAGIPVTDPLRMLVDLGAIVGADAVARALDACLVERLVTLDGVKAELGRLSARGRGGTGVLRAVLADWPLADARPESVLEVRFARLCRRAGLPRLVYQHEILVGGRRRRVDFADPHRRIAVEVDGLASRIDRAVFRHERTRQNDLVLAGWRVVRFTWFDVLYCPDRVAATLAEVLGAANTA